MRRLTAALSAGVIFGAIAVNAPPAAAQTVEIGPGGGVGLDLRSPRQRDRDELREEARRERQYERRRARRDDDLATGTVGCREVTIRERDEDGDTVTRTRRDCR
ncbi:MAG: hypothetical protein JWR08_1224 [Enterovirga sp.]|nr:hypothetical protein [Enterovirga sp.]